MSSSNSSPNPDVSLVSDEDKSPDFETLVRFLIEPFLDARDSLRVDCESLSKGSRLLVRVAFEGEDRGRVFGRGGRNIQAIRRVVEAVGNLANIQVRLNVYGEGSALEQEGSDRNRRRPSSRPSRPSRPRRRNSSEGA
ncbi:MAG: KH domain-containing protein [Cyanobacteria bacterium P01_D01_bin.128]